MADVEQLLERAQRLRSKMAQASVDFGITSLDRPAEAGRALPSKPRLSNSAAAELELILAEDPMCGGAAPGHLPAAAPKSAETTLAASSLEASGGHAVLRLCLRRVELEVQAARRAARAGRLWLRCKLPGLEEDEVLVEASCQQAAEGSQTLVVNHTSVHSVTPAQLRELAEQPLRLCLFGQAEVKPAANATPARGSTTRAPLLLGEAEVHLPTAASLEPGSRDVEAELRAAPVREGNTKQHCTTTPALPVGRVFLSCEVLGQGREAGAVNSHPPEKVVAQDERGVHLWLWLGHVTGKLDDAEDLRVVIKLGQSQEIEMSSTRLPSAEHDGRPDSVDSADYQGVFGRHAVSGNAVWQVHAPTASCLTGPMPAVVFLQLWHASKLCGMVKVPLSQLEPEAVRNVLNVSGYVELFNGDLDIRALTSNVSLGTVHVCMHAGLATVLLALGEQLAAEARRSERDQVPPHISREDLAAAKLLLALEEKSSSVFTQLDAVQGPLDAVQGSQGYDGSRGSLTLLRSSEIRSHLLHHVSGLLPREAAALTAYLLQLADVQPASVMSTGTLLRVMNSAVSQVKDSVDQLVKEVGDECGTVALDLLDVGMPARLRRQDVSKVLQLRGLDVSWGTLEGIFQTLGCTDAVETLPAQSLARLVRAQAEVRLREVARMRHLEHEAAAWLRSQLPPSIGERQGAVTGPNAARNDWPKLVDAHARKDGTLDVLALTVLLRTVLEGRSSQDVDQLAQRLSERLGVGHGGRVPAQLLANWLEEDRLDATEASNNNSAPAVSSSRPQKLPEGPSATQVRSGDSINTENIHWKEELESATQMPLPQIQQEQQLEHFGYDDVECERAPGPCREAVQGTVQLAKPLTKASLSELEQVLAAALGLPQKRLRVLAAQEGSSHVCLQVLESSSSSLATPSAAAAMAALAQQLGDPRSQLGRSSLGTYFC
eukprot:TRINITY_DN58956_c0_g1_i1.p1 TRINITY_DN58956_c0_g1~~TRINITY_DN58956_c0_g1_i1.p1  ORF type:complete len:972 (-),score=216.20 TRINITY_DN58956_c0_g1_i1:47-2878(-)